MDSLIEAKLLLPHEAARLEKVDFRYLIIDRHIDQFSFS
jgi:hypothetical protein